MGGGGQGGHGRRERGRAWAAGAGGRLDSGLVSGALLLGSMPPDRTAARPAWHERAAGRAGDGHACHLQQVERIWLPPRRHLCRQLALRQQGSPVSSMYGARGDVPGVAALPRGRRLAGPQRLQPCRAQAAPPRPHSPPRSSMQTAQAARSWHTRLAAAAALQLAGRPCPDLLWLDGLVRNEVCTLGHRAPRRLHHAAPRQPAAHPRVLPHLVRGRPARGQAGTRASRPRCGQEGARPGAVDALACAQLNWTPPHAKAPLAAGCHRQPRRHSPRLQLPPACPPARPPDRPPTHRCSGSGRSMASSSAAASSDSQGGTA